MDEGAPVVGSRLHAGDELLIHRRWHRHPVECVSIVDPHDHCQEEDPARVGRPELGAVPKAAVGIESKATDGREAAWRKAAPLTAPRGRQLIALLEARSPLPRG